MPAERVLLVEDDPSVGSALAEVLAAEGLVIRWERTGAAALDAGRSWDPGIVLLDLGLPDVDGVDVCRGLRAAGVTARILALTARAEEVDIVVGLDAGADDYLAKPFRLAELLARVRALSRRGGGPERALRSGELVIDPSARRATVRGRELPLRPREYDLLALLVAESGRVLARELIMDRLWDRNWFGATKTLDVHIASLRRKLGAAGPAESLPVISTLRGVGYRLDPP